MPLSKVLDSPAVYRLWQAPFAAQKLRPVLSSGITSRARSVLDVGCGPGTNAVAFRDVGIYLGVDLDPRYIKYASQKYNMDFRVADVTEGIPTTNRFDLILLNSLMHHLTDAEAARLLRSLPALLAESGEIHILDLVLPPSGLGRRLAMADRGKHARSLVAWDQLVGSSLTLHSSHPYSLTFGPIRLWNMVHIVAST